jgi:hypothetical protein
MTVEFEGRSRVPCFYRHSLRGISSPMTTIASGSMNLDNSCFSRSPVSPEGRQVLINKFWPPNATSDDDNVEDFTAYFNFLQQECDPASQQINAIQSYADLAYVLGIVKGNADATMSDLRQTLMNVQPSLGRDETKLSASIELVVRLWLTVNIRNLMPNDRICLQSFLPWPDSLSLMEVLQRWTDQSQTQAQSQPPVSTSPLRGEFPDVLNVCDLKQTFGYKIQWTNDLTNHLAMNGSVIYLYHHVSVLKRIRNSVSP